MTKKAQLIQLRKKVQLIAKRGLNNTQIAEKLKVSRDFVIKWKKEKNVDVDKRGWRKGKKRKYTNEQEQLVIQKRLELEQKFFLELRQYFKNYRKRISQKISSIELFITTISLNLIIKNKKVAQAIYSIQRNGYLGLGYSSRLTSSVLAISRVVVSLITFSAVNMLDHSNSISSFGSKLKLAQRY